MHSCECLFVPNRNGITRITQRKEHLSFGRVKYAPARVRRSTMKNKHVKRIVLTAMFIALTCVATMFLQIPVPGMANGYVNLGDAILLIGAFFLGPVYGAVAAGVGAALADILLSFATYAPATLIIKALMAVVFWLIAVAPMKKQPVLGVKIVFVAVGALASEVIMVLGYFVYESFLYGVAGAAGSLIGNTVQGVCGLVIAAVLVNILSSNKKIRELADI